MLPDTLTFGTQEGKGQPYLREQDRIMQKELLAGLKK
jgi:hypothetical protein